MVRTFLRFVVQSCLVLAAFLVFDSSSAFGKGANPFFTPPTFPGTGQAISADVNGDGKPDLLFFDGTVLLGKGDGTFATGTAWRSTTASDAPVVNQFAIADFNGDGKPDIFFAGPLNGLSVMLGNGDGTFQAPVTTSIASAPAAFLVGDLNGDGKPDVLVQVNGGFVYLGKGDGTFAAGIATNAASPEVANAFADFNGDGKLDLLVPGSGVQLGNGDGTFQALLPFPAGALTASVTLGDFDGDGKLDVFVTGGTSTSPEIQVLFGNGDGTFRAASPQSVSANAGISSPVVVDLNGDGKADIVGSTGSAAQLLISKGDGTFTPSAYYNAPAGQSGTSTPNMVVADFNGDKKPDVAAFNTMLLGNGDGTLQGNPAVPGAFGFNAMGDFNGDGHQDFASTGPVEGSPANGYQANLNIWLNDGKNNFTLAHTYAINIPNPNLADEIALVGFTIATDLNGDGKIDLIGYLADASGLSMIVVLGNGAGSFGAPISTRVTSAANHLLQLASTVGDLNGDGTFGTPTTPFVGGSIGEPVVGDFNNDKKMDVITGTVNGLGVLLGNGDGTFGSPLKVTNAGYPFVADFNGDNKLDILEVGANQLVWLFNNGRAAVTPPSTPPDFCVGSGSGGGTATVTAGGSATYPLSLAGSGGFTGSVALTCSVAPTGPACTVSPSSVSLSGSTAATATVSVTTTARSRVMPIGAPSEPESSRRILWIFGAFLAAAGVITLLADAQVRPRRSSWSLAMACGAILLLSASLISGCGQGSNSTTGSGGSSVTGTSAGSYTVTVTAQSGSVVHKTQLTLIVQ